MAWKAEPRYYPSRDAWYVQIEGRKILLAKGRGGRAAAWAAFHKMMASGTATADTLKIEVETLADLFLDDCQKRLAATTFTWYRGHLQSFSDVHGRARMASIRPLHVQSWLDRHPDWSDSTRHGGITAIKRLSAWAKQQGYLDTDRLAGLPRPGIKRRAAHLSQEDVGRICAATTDQDFLDLLTVLRETGCRPSEAYRIEAAMLDQEARVAVLERSKTSAKTGRPRVLFLTPRAAEILARRAAQYPEGPLLRNTDGAPWNRNAVSLRFRRLRARLGLGPEATAEAFRHGYATDALERGVPIATVAELLGHRGTRMLEAYYSHLHERHDHLRAATGRIRPDAPDLSAEDA
jgi:integrase